MQTKHPDGKDINEWQPESLMELLIAQCADLEGLLALARRENVAVNSGDFADLVLMCDERARIGNRLESYHRQVSELRARLGREGDVYIDPSLSNKTIRLAVEIKAQDVMTASLLRVSQTRTTQEIARLDRSEHNSLAYLSSGRGNGLRCDRRG